MIQWRPGEARGGQRRPGVARGARGGQRRPGEPVEARGGQGKPGEARVG